MNDVPEGFAEKAATHTNSELQEMFSVGRKSVLRLRRIVGVPSPPVDRSHPRKMPEGFAGRAKTMTRSQLCAYYSCSYKTLARLIREADVEPMSYNRARPRKMMPIDTVKPSLSYAGEAAEYLKRWGAVTRCNEAGRFDPKGSMWRRGSAILTDDEVIERAVAKGWDRNDWRKLRAA